MNLAGYRQAVTQLRNASRGSYGGPSVSPLMLQQAYDSVDGVDTAELRAGARLAAGSTETAGVQQWLLPVAKFIGSLGAGMVASELLEKAQTWFNSRDEAEEVADAAGRAADAIDNTLTESDQGTEAILAQLAEIIAQISEHLATIDFSEHPEAFATVVQAGADIINDAAAMVLGLCADRDKAIEECYCALIAHGKRVCEQPAPELVDAVPGAVAGSSSGGGSAAPTEPAGIADRVEKSVTPPVTTPASIGEQLEETKEQDAEKKNVEEKAVVTKEEKPAEETDCEDKTELEPVTACAEEAAGPEDIEVEEAAAAEPRTDHHVRNTVIATVRVGLLLAGVGAIAHFVEQAVQEFLGAMTPESETLGETAPTETEREAAPPINKTVEADLAEVPEPLAKPMPVTVQANYAPNPDPPAPSAPAPDPVVAAEQGQRRVRKAGGWT